jgi:hypothetical protein
VSADGGRRRWQAMDIREYRVGFRQQAMSREEAQSSMFKMLQEAWEKNNGFDDEEWGETQSPPFILKRATDKKVWRGQTRVGGARQARARAPLRRLSFELCVTLCGSRRHGVCAVRRAPCEVRGARCEVHGGAADADKIALCPAVQIEDPVAQNPRSTSVA